ncbi:GNAT family N-acetyltransferase [Diaminobutyricibacter tongyongensis]|uniref:GNAT family N-acetyltransferase n=2 Tax=Leifsonia tongyongensis TaxID=1268043 RepID=A0A6L9XZ78_9MICO|nr:GNAT family N-acetyltransferase [Diaminobutyricibacter tongyongensis]
MDPAIELRGRVVTLTGVRDPERDARELYEALDDDRVWRHVAGRPADIPALAGRLEDALVPGPSFPWIVRLATPYRGLPEGTVVGQTSYLDVSVPDARLEIGSTLYRHDVWASAVNPETKLLLLENAFDRLGAGRVQLKTDIRNERSQRAIDRLGARYEGVLRRYQRRAEGTVRDTVLFSIVAEEWPDVRRGLNERLRSASDR